jgi:hypothetical protein
MRSLVKILSMLMLFTAPVVGQEAGDNVRALFKNPSSGVQSQLDSIFGVITPDLQFETDVAWDSEEKGAIIAKNELIDPEYFVVSRPKTVLSAVRFGIGLVWIAEAVRTCRFSQNDTSGGWMPLPDDLSCTGFSWPLVIGLGVPIGIPLSFVKDLAKGEWKPW